ncbi:MAG: hypothetical protein J3K34DRAFT_441427 [Monoraphidium minutum]|nr:MAG: hypothetical protein J3K34DRAFT_441427 [Monoraphidium minutum]
MPLPSRMRFFCLFRFFGCCRRLPASAVRTRSIDDMDDTLACRPALPPTTKDMFWAVVLLPNAQVLFCAWLCWRRAGAAQGGTHAKSLAHPAGAVGAHNQCRC